MAQLALGETPAPRPCEWCGEPACARVVGTVVCQPCKDGGRRVRVIAALQRWKRGIEARGGAA